MSYIRFIERLGKARVVADIQPSKPVLDELITFVDLFNPIVIDTKYPLSIRLRAISAISWILPAPHEERSREFIDKFVENCALLNLSQEEVTLILNVITERINMTPTLAGMGIQVAGEWFKKDSKVLKPEAMIALWENSCKSAPQPLLEYLYTLLDTDLNTQNRLPILRLQIAGMWFLGSHACELCQDTNKESSCTGEGIAGVSNLPLLSIILRLESIARTGTWLSRRVSIGALIKIAINVGEPIKITLYEMLLNLKEQHREEKELYYDELIDPALDALDTYYEAKQTGNSSLLTEYQFRVALLGAN